MKYNQPFGISDPNAPYINGNPATGTMGSIPPASSVEYDQREIVAVIKYAFDNKLIDFNNVLCAAPDNADLTQLLKAIFGMTNKNKLQADATLYINSTTGDDLTGDGSLTKPYRTYQKAINSAQAVMDLNQKHTITFHGTGTFSQTGPIIQLGGLFAGQNGAGSVIFDNTNTTFHTDLGDCIDIWAGACTIKGGTYSCTWDGVTTNQGCGIQVGGSSVVDWEGGTFGVCNRCHIFNYGIFLVGLSYSINGGAPNHVIGLPQSVYQHYGTSDAMAAAQRITLNGVPNFSNSFCNMYGGSAGFGFSFVGSATGQKFYISGYGTISTNYRGVNFLPGNIAGVIAGNTGNGEYT